MPKKTQHYQLNQWEAGDSFLRADFNEDNTKLEAALERLETAKCQAVFGSFIGDGTSGRSISLGLTPKAVLLVGGSGQTYTNGDTYGGLFTTQQPLKSGNNTVAAQISEGGFTVSYLPRDNCYVNCDSDSFHYAAFC